MDFLSWLRPPTPTPKVGAKARSREATMTFGDSSGSQPYSSMNGYTDFLNALTIPAVFECVGVISDALAKTPLEVLDKATGEPVDLERQAPDLFDLLENPNDLNNGFEFRQQQAMDLLLTGNNVVALTDLDGFDRPHRLTRLRPDRVKVRIRDDGSLTYLFGPGGNFTRPDEIPQDQVVHWRRPNPQDPIWGMGEVEAGSVTLQADRLLNELIRAYFERGAILDGVIMLPQEDLSEADYKTMVERWRGQRQRGRATVKTGVLTGGAKYERIQEPLGNIPVVQIKKMSRNEIFELFGVPPAKRGDFVGSNYRNSQEADSFFFSETIAPLARRVEPGWTSLSRRWNRRWVMRYKLPNMAADFESRAKAAASMATANSFTRNQILVAAGQAAYPPGDPLGEEIINVTRSAVPEPVEAAKDGPKAQDPTPGSGAENDEHAA